MNETKKRCKNGERRNTLGICEKKTQKQTLRPDILSDKPVALAEPIKLEPKTSPPTKTKRSRCKKGERKNKQGVCEKKNTTAKLPSKSSSLSSLLPLSVSPDQNLLPPTPIEPTPIEPTLIEPTPQITGKTKRSRCKKGERKNKEGVCEKKTSTSAAKAPSKSASLKPQSLNTTISYRPSINKQLVSIRSASELHNIQHCNNFENNEIDFPLKININGKCISVNKKEAKQYLLKELKKINI